MKNNKSECGDKLYIVEDFPQPQLPGKGHTETSNNYTAVCAFRLFCIFQTNTICNTAWETIVHNWS